MLIGPGGGLDILLASAVGAKQIDGAELNPSIPRDRAAAIGDFNGQIYDYRTCNIQVDEGRSFVARSDKQYDLIYMALTKTATTARTRMALIEGYIYTTEAFEEYYRHLTRRRGAGLRLPGAVAAAAGLADGAGRRCSMRPRSGPASAAQHLAVVDCRR